MTNKTKEILHQQCLSYVAQMINNAQQALNAAKEAGNDETKSSAGDKHETGRAMAQLEQEKMGKQLRDATELSTVLTKIVDKQQTRKVALGSLVITDTLCFYIAIAAGKLEVGGKTYFAISPNSPIGAALLGLSVNEDIKFNGQVYKVKQLL